jgi:hypothetical protein
MGDQPSRKAPTYLGQTNTEKTRTDVHASSGIQNHGPAVRMDEDISCLRQRGNCDRHFKVGMELCT